MADKDYRRLPGTGYRRTVPAIVIVLLFFVVGIFALLLRGRRSQLWQGKDHLLLVEWDGYRELYKRFGYRDIQAITIQKTEEGKIINIVFGLITAFFMAVSISMDDQAGRIAFMIVAGIFGLCLTANALIGPTCKSFIRTAVQTEDLPSLSRVRRARKVFARIRPLIAQAQGELNPEEIPSRMRESVLQPAAPPQPAFPAAPSDGPGAPPVIS